jgi:hypothetical protein
MEVQAVSLRPVPWSLSASCVASSLHRSALESKASGALKFARRYHEQVLSESQLAQDKSLKSLCIKSSKACGVSHSTPLCLYNGSRSMEDKTKYR